MIDIVTIGHVLTWALFAGALLALAAAGCGWGYGGASAEPDERTAVCAGPGRWMCSAGYGHLCEEEGDS